MIRTTLALASVLSIALASSASPQVITGGAGNTGIPAPSVTGGVRAGTIGKGEVLDDRNPPPPVGNAASPSSSSVPSTTPGVNIGGTSTSGPPGIGGTAGGPTLSGR